MDLLTKKRSNRKYKPRSRNKSSKYRGVSKCSKDGRWQSRIRVGKIVKYLGRYSTQEEAAKAYDMGALKYHAHKAVTNFDKSEYGILDQTTEQTQASNTTTADLIPMNKKVKLGLEPLNVKPLVSTPPDKEPTFDLSTILTAQLLALKQTEALGLLGSPPTLTPPLWNTNSNLWQLPATAATMTLPMPYSLPLFAKPMAYDSDVVNGLLTMAAQNVLN